MLVIRMRRVGAKKRPVYRVVVAESSSPREGAFIESLGHYDPRTNPETVKVDRDRLAYWLKAGAQPSDTVRTIVARHKLDEAAAAAPAASPGPAEGTGTSESSTEQPAS
jgi:small subunit ribosomal protein S16